MSTAILLQQILMIFIIVGVGIVAGKLKIITSEQTGVLSEFLMKISLPATLLASTSYGEGRQTTQELFLVFIINIVFYILCTIICEILARVMKLTQEKRAVFVMFCVLPNNLFIGMPLVTALFGESSMTYVVASVMCYNLYFFTYGTKLFSKDSKFNVKSLLTPGNIASTVMIIMLFFGLKLPTVVQDACSILGGATTPIALVLIGLMLSGGNLLSILKNKFLYIITFIRCIAFPILLTFLLKLLGLDVQIAFSVVIILSCAAGAMGATLAKQKNVEPELSSMAVLHSTLFLIITLPLVSIIAQNVLGI